MENFPVAFILASCDEVYKDNNVLYRLVRPAKDGNGVESTDRLVNVVPYRRTYQFRARSDINEFIHEILTRPLVLQPVLHFGRGLGSCGACYSDEPWVVMINQTHPKVLSRLQMGLDAAQAAFAKGHSAELKFKFGKAIQRLYCKNLEEKEFEDAKGSKLRTILPYFRFSEWEHAELIIRFHGYTPHRSQRKSSQNVNLEFNFEDITCDELQWSEIGSQVFPLPHLAPVTEEEIRTVLPSWTINGVSPLQNLGEEVPHLNYSYKKAGTLYESFRKKKKHRDLPPNYNEYLSESVGNYPEESLGAVGGREAFDAIEHDFTKGSERIEEGSTRSNSRRAYMYGQNPYSSTEYSYGEHARMSSQDYGYENEHTAVSVSSYDTGMYSNKPYATNPQPLNLPHQRPPEVNGHIDADVRIVAPSQVADYEAKSNKSSTSHLYQSALRIKKQDSDRSTGSTNADSGYNEDGRRSRGDSYDYNDNVGSGKFKYGREIDERHYDSKMDVISPGGLDNPAFSHHDEADDALARHKRMVAEAITSHVQPPAVSPGRPSDTEQIAESFI